MPALRTALRFGVVLAAAVGTQASAEPDYSNLTLNLDNAWLLVVDPNGARTGRDPASGKEVNEIPAAAEWADAIDNDVTGEAAKSFSMTVHIDRPAAGAYRVVVVGQRRGASKLVVSAWATDGSEQPSISVPIDLKRGSRNEYQLHFQGAPGSSLRLDKMEP